MINRIWIKFKRRFIPLVLAYGGKYLMRILLSTCKIRVKGTSRLIDTAHNTPCIIMLWHHRLVLVSEILHKFTSDLIFTAFISKSRDGDPLAILAESYKRGKALRVPHNLRHHALRQMIDRLKKMEEVMVITPDGPRGPREMIKPGVVAAAKEAEAHIVPFSWTAHKFWELKTWDRMQIPKPFTTIEVSFGNAVTVSNDASPEMEALRLQAVLQNHDKTLKDSA